MDKQYRNLMQQQNVGEEGNAAFYEKLETTKPRRRPIRWKVALIAACLVMLIPLTALAGEYFFGVPEVKMGKLDWHDSPNGFSVHFDNLEDLPLEVFPEDMQYFSQIERVPCNSWEAAEEALGIDLINNTVLTPAHKITMRYDDIGSVYGQILYTPYEGQLYYVTASAYYSVNNVQMDLKAEMTVKHPKLDAETSRLLHGVEGVTTKPEDAETSYESYTTDAGIPVAILRWDLGSVIHYDAVFAVNDISYELNAYIHPGEEETEKLLLLDVLNGFSLS